MFLCVRVPENNISLIMQAQIYAATSAHRYNHHLQWFAISHYFLKWHNNPIPNAQDFEVHLPSSELRRYK